MGDDAVLASLFDAAWYVATYPDVARCDAWKHFQLVGALAGRNLNPMFCTAWSVAASLL